MKPQKVRRFFWEIILILFFIVILMASCKQQSKGAAVTGLSELQISACNSADTAKTCDTRLQEVGIVLKEDCCRELGKCC